MKEKLSQKRLKEVIHYDPDTGEFKWKVKRKGTKSNKLAGGYDNDGYLLISIDYILYKAHRLAFLYMTSEFPKGIVDHKDRNTSNNKWKNIRESNHSTNAYNTGLNKNNTSGHKGVYWDKSKKKWTAEIKVNYKKKFLGRFTEKEEAISARKKAETTFIFSD